MHTVAEEIRYVPKTCTWELTRRCASRCGHCGSSAGEARPNELSLTRALEVVAELGALGCERLTLSGGEPTLSPHWEDVASAADRHGIAVNMVTSSLIPATDLVRRAKSAGLRSIGVSLDGLENTHDGIRNREGAFASVMDLLQAARTEQLPVAAITTITKRNVAELTKLHELLYGKVYAWRVQLGAAMGRLGERPEQQIQPEQLLTLVPTLAALIETRRIAISVGDNIGYYGPYEGLLRQYRSGAADRWTGCRAGRWHLGIEADGGVKGCLSLQCSSHTEGNLARESLSDIWFRQGGFAYNRSSSVLSGFCATCQYAKLCRGGCYSMRGCDGGEENRFCYHRVATLAERTARTRLRGNPVNAIPAAVLALAAAACSSEDVYGCPWEVCGSGGGEMAEGGATQGGGSSYVGNGGGGGSSASSGGSFAGGGSSFAGSGDRGSADAAGAGVSATSKTSPD